MRRKKHTEKEVHAHLISVVSVRLREGYTIREISLTKGSCNALRCFQSCSAANTHCVRGAEPSKVGLSWRWSWCCCGNTTCTLNTWQPPPGLWTPPRGAPGWRWPWRGATTSCMTLAAPRGSQSPARIAPPSFAAFGTHCRGTNVATTVVLRLPCQELQVWHCKCHHVTPADARLSLLL